jgi:hypothetical protein
MTWQRIVLIALTLVCFTLAFTLLRGTEGQTALASFGAFLIGLLAPQVGKGAGAATVLLLLIGIPSLTTACQTGVNWPAVAKCVPTEEIGKDIVNEIEGILLDGGDYEQALADLARKYGPDGPRMVVCVVNALLGDWTGETGSAPRADPKHTAGAARARAFLKHAGTRVETP